MADESAAAAAGAGESAHPVAATGLLKEEEAPHRVVIRPYPSVVYLYPTVLFALVCGVFTLVFSKSVDATLADGSTQELLAVAMQPKLFGFLFLLVFAFNMSVLAFDFTRATFVALILFFGVLGLGGWILENQFELLTRIGTVVGKLHFYANPAFYFAIFAVFLVIYLMVFVQTRFDYWELQHNELLHHRGIVGDVERFSAHYLRWTKEIPDVFEYCLLLSGRLVFYVKERDRPIVLNNVFNINRLETRMAKIQATVHVKVEGH